MYSMCVCLFSALNRKVGALQISIIIIIIVIIRGRGRLLSLAGDATSIKKIVATKLCLSRQTRVCRDNSFVSISILLSRQILFIKPQNDT